MLAIALFAASLVVNEHRVARRSLAVCGNQFGQQAAMIVGGIVGLVGQIVEGGVGIACRAVSFDPAMKFQHAVEIAFLKVSLLAVLEHARLEQCGSPRQLPPGGEHFGFDCVAAVTAGIKLSEASDQRFERRIGLLQRQFVGQILELVDFEAHVRKILVQLPAYQVRLDAQQARQVVERLRILLHSPAMRGDGPRNVSQFKQRSPHVVENVGIGPGLVLMPLSCGIGLGKFPLPEKPLGALVLEYR